MLNAFAYFPSIIYRDEHPEWVDELNKFLEKYFELCDKNQTLCQTPNFMDDSDIKFFSDYILDVSNEILLDQGYSMNKYNLHISELWGQKIEKNSEGMKKHIHKNSQLCGWIFIETPFGGSYPIYSDSRTYKKMVELDFVQEDEITNATSSIHFNNILPGTVLFSNSWMEHELTHNSSNSPTKLIHFIISHRDKLWNTF